MTDDTALVTVLDRIIPMINKRREVEVDMEKCKKRNTEHCTKSKQYSQFRALKSVKF